MLTSQHLRNAYKRGCLFESSGSKSEVLVLRHNSDSVQAFVDDCIIDVIGNRPKKKDIFGYYEKYCVAENLKSIGRNGFYQSMIAKGIQETTYCGYDCFKDIAISTDIPFSGVSGVL